MFKWRHGSTYNTSQELCISLLWRPNGRDGVSNHQPHDCLFNYLFKRGSRKISKLRVTGLCAGNSPGTGEFPAQMASNAENVSIWWRHHVTLVAFFVPYFDVLNLLVYLPLSSMLTVQATRMIEVKILLKLIMSSKQHKAKQSPLFIFVCYTAQWYPYRNSMDKCWLCLCMLYVYAYIYRFMPELYICIYIYILLCKEC